MRLIPQILALLLAITSIAVPCVAKTQIGDAAPINSNSAVLSAELDKDTCHGTCIKAIITRQDNNFLAAIVDVSGNGLIPKNLQQSNFRVANITSVEKPPNAICANPVDLHTLCRLLN